MQQEYLKKQKTEQRLKEIDDILNNKGEESIELSEGEDSEQQESQSSNSQDQVNQDELDIISNLRNQLAQFKQEIDKEDDSANKK